MISVKKLDDKQLEVIKNMLLERVPLEEISQHVINLNTRKVEIYGVTSTEIENAFKNVHTKRVDGELTKLLAKMDIKEEFYNDPGFWNGLTFEYFIEFINIRKKDVYKSQDKKVLQRLFFTPSQSNKTRNMVYSLFLNLLCTYEENSNDPFDLTWFVIDEYYEFFNIIYDKTYFKNPEIMKTFLKAFKKFVEDGNNVGSKDLQYVGKILSEASGVYYLDFFNEDDFYQLLKEELL